MKKDQTIILFDGICNSCNGFVQFLLDHDVQGKFLFSSIQSPTGQSLIEQNNLTDIGLTSLVVIGETGTYIESTAIFYIFEHLPFPWKVVSVFKWLPTHLTDFFYRLISRNRYRWFGKSHHCRIPSPEEKHRFLE